MREYSVLEGLPGVMARLASGARVLALGCGDGASAVALALAYPRVRVVGLDERLSSILDARRNVAHAGLAGRVIVEVADGTALPTGQFDLVLAFGVFAPAARPRALLRSVLRALVPSEGVAIIVEPADAATPVEALVREERSASLSRPRSPDPGLVVLALRCSAA